MQNCQKLEIERGQRKPEEQITICHNGDKNIEIFSSMPLISRSDNSHCQFQGSRPFA